MIGYLKGTLKAKGPGLVLIEVNGIGYEVSLPGYVEYRLRDTKVGEEVELYILYHHPDNQSRPRLIGFRNQVEREFFEELTTVQDIGPAKALSVFASPVGKIARAIAERNETALTRIKGVGPKLARRIITELSDGAAKYALLPSDDAEVTPPTLDDAKEEVLAALTTQLGHSRSEATKMIERALKANSDINTAEELFEEVYRGEKT